MNVYIIINIYFKVIWLIISTPTAKAGCIQWLFSSWLETISLWCQFNSKSQVKSSYWSKESIIILFNDILNIFLIHSNYAIRHINTALASLSYIYSKMYFICRQDFIAPVVHDRLKWKTAQWTSWNWSILNNKTSTMSNTFKIILKK